MMIVDFRTIPKDHALEADIAIVGAGPAGLTIARELASTNLKIVIFESGGRNFHAGIQSLNAVENIGDRKIRN